MSFRDFITLNDVHSYSKRRCHQFVQPYIVVVTAAVSDMLSHVLMSGGCIIWSMFGADIWGFLSIVSDATISLLWSVIHAVAVFDLDC